jgi:deoxycytidine triphosphate deaminase
LPDFVQPKLRNFGYLIEKNMTIKSDKWIRRMAQETGMIEPFEPGQVRTANGEKIVSYGTSSYGYDIRCANEFKIFTNINSTIVDPKNFDEKSFVDFRGEVCIIPPNSFALARTVEYFRIPRSVLTICLGKSTYARCFSADTRVALADGTAPTIEELATRADQGPVWGYSISEYGRIIVSLLDAPRYIGRDALLEITLDNGKVINATADHNFILRDGRKMVAGDLRPGQSLMPLYRQLARGYEMTYQPLNGYLEATHRLADEWNLRNGLYEASSNTHRHHRDHDRRNNMPWNIERMAASEHIRHHNAGSYGVEFDADAHGESIRDALARLTLDPDWKENYSTVQRNRAVSFWHEEAYANARERLRQVRVEAWTNTRREAKRQELIDRYANTQERQMQGERMQAAWAGATQARRDNQREIARQINLRADITEERVREALHQTGSIRGAARQLNCDRSTFRRFPHVIAEVAGRGAPRNHKIVSIRELPGVHDVYCLTVPEAGNFALDAGVFVENCGIIVNVTPFEPEWEGFVTLEFSNTTPLPAKIYAGEGCAQVLFFESDEVCEMSYKDRGGKYQGQTGVTLPKA